MLQISSSVEGSLWSFSFRQALTTFPSDSLALIVTFASLFSTIHAAPVGETLPNLKTHFAWLHTSGYECQLLSHLKMTSPTEISGSSYPITIYIASDFDLVHYTINHPLFIFLPVLSADKVGNRFPKYTAQLLYRNIMSYLFRDLPKDM